MPTIQSDTTQYKFNLDEVKKMFAKELSVPEEAITVSYDLRDTSDDRYGSYNVTSVSVTVDNKKLKK